MVSGPYTTGARARADRKRNLEALNRAAYEVFRRGHVPIVGVNLALPSSKRLETNGTTR
jgi:hypothetical protein